MSPAADTVTVSATVLSLDPVLRGRLLGFAAVEIDIAGIAFELCGVRVIRTPQGTFGIEAPQYRGPDGASRPAIALPPELAQAIGAAVLDVAEVEGARFRRTRLRLRNARFTKVENALGIVSFASSAVNGAGTLASPFVTQRNSASPRVDRAPHQR